MDEAQTSIVGLRRQLHEITLQIVRVLLDEPKNHTDLEALDARAAQLRSAIRELQQPEKPVWDVLEYPRATLFRNGREPKQVTGSDPFPGAPHASQTPEC